jgi:chromate transport protein ChrA
VVTGRGWMTGQEFVNFFALAQAIPGPNMILMMGFVGWKVWGIPGAVVSSFATFAPPCGMYFVAYRLWDRFRTAPWQRIVRNRLIPVTVGLVIASGDNLEWRGHNSRTFAHFEFRLKHDGRRDGLAVANLNSAKPAHRRLADLDRLPG